MFELNVRIGESTEELFDERFDWLVCSSGERCHPPRDIVGQRVRCGRWHNGSLFAPCQTSCQTPELSGGRRGRSMNALSEVDLTITIDALDGARHDRLVI
jgi:hypothetical protein